MTQQQGEHASNKHHKIHRARTIVLGVLRIIALAMIVVGAVMVLNRMLFGVLASGNFVDSWTIWTGIGATHGVYLGLPLVVVGVVLGFMSTRFARWVVQPPAMGCGCCGYATIDEDGRCSECGYR